MHSEQDRTRSVIVPTIAFHPIIVPPSSRTGTEVEQLALLIVLLKYVKEKGKFYWEISYWTSENIGIMVTNQILLQITLLTVFHHQYFRSQIKRVFFQQNEISFPHSVIKEREESQWHIKKSFEREQPILMMFVWNLIKNNFIPNLSGNFFPLTNRCPEITVNTEEIDKHVDTTCYL